MASQKGRPPLGAPALISPLGHGLTRSSLAGPALGGGPRAPSSSLGLEPALHLHRTPQGRGSGGRRPTLPAGILKSSTLGGAAAALLRAGGSTPWGTVASSGDTSGGRGGDAGQHPGGTSPGPGHLARCTPGLLGVAGAEGRVGSPGLSPMQQSRASRHSIGMPAPGPSVETRGLPRAGVA